MSFSELRIFDLEKQIIILFQAIFEDVVDHQADDPGDGDLDEDDRQPGIIRSCLFRRLPGWKDCWFC